MAGTIAVPKLSIETDAQESQVKSLLFHLPSKMVSYLGTNRPNEPTAAD
jgi:hypothetical protein